MLISLNSDNHFFAVSQNLVAIVNVVIVSKLHILVPEKCSTLRGTTISILIFSEKCGINKYFQKTRKLINHGSENLNIRWFLLVVVYTVKLIFGKKQQIWYHI